jgi:hypothetical protein
MNIILGYAALHDFKKYYAQYGEPVFEILLHDANQNSFIIKDLLSKTDTTLDSEHKKKLFVAATHASPFMRYSGFDIDDINDVVFGELITYIRQFGDMCKLTYLVPLTEHDTKLICSYAPWLFQSLNKANESNFEKIVQHLFKYFKDDILSHRQTAINLFSDNTNERREYIANELSKIVDIRALSIMINVNCINPSIIEEYKKNHLDHFISQMSQYTADNLYSLIRSFRKEKLPDIVETNLLTNDLYMLLDATRCKTICKKNNISENLKSVLRQYMKSQYILKELSE